ncbi:sodium-dependent transporter [Nesterenkonia alkaliphila]|uniref:Transporter n=1 Tax=Nesterenkonia alkaliphila TaxID=1463631 RepID=A0A7K1UMM1_9MICC|nr:sodium-dependent transporter [Nesterenkonia alkaliphila]MVT27717.1 sodium-dependent transporter [Nesterenkonia alkaliphila]GFZ87704.1 transporter [Nesterenkonia alkaliphila]
MTDTAGNRSGFRIRESFSGRTAFILVAIGSAVGLGNIWRFPYVTYENGGGAFLIPYLIALLTAGLPILLFDYAMGYKFRGSPPLAFKRMHPSAEAVGWFQVGICFLIAIYYAAIVAWAAMYTWFSLTQAWGEDAEGFFFAEFLQYDGGGAEGAGISVDFVAQVGWPLIVVWVLLLAALATGVRKGLTAISLIGMPVLFLMFAVLVGYSLTLEGATTGLNALFTPDWGALTDATVWIQAYGQIFFSLSVGFGIMITYASYLRRKSNATGSGLVVGFANSSFEVLAAIGVFSALGFLAVAAGTAVDEVASSGLGLAFVAFPTIISEAPASALLGVLFFGSLTLAGITSLISILEVVVSAVKDKTGWSRPVSVAAAGLPAALISVVLIGGVSGVTILDVVDAFSNNVGIVLGAFASVVLATWVYRKLDVLRAALNAYGSLTLGPVWKTLIGVVLPLVLGVLLVLDIRDKILEGYGGFDTWVLATFGWGSLALMIVVSVGLSLMPWSESSAMHMEDPDRDEAGKETV